MNKEPLKAIRLHGRRISEPIVILNETVDIAFEGNVKDFTCLLLTSDGKSDALNFDIWIESTEGIPLEFEITPLPKPFF